MFQRRVRRMRGGGFQLRLTEAERNLLRSLPAELRAVLKAGDPAADRLFPPAYPDDRDRNEEYAGLVRGDLLDGRLTALDVVEQTLDADRLSEDELTAWLGALNDLRLVLGTRLEVTEDLYEQGMPDDDPRAQGYAVYSYLGWLQEQVIAALAEGVDAAGTAESTTGS